nr:hypothetical protein [uncultured Desulfobacter sp.]
METSLSYILYTVRPFLKERVRNNSTWERGRPTCIFTAGGTPALPDIAKWASYLRPLPKRFLTVYLIILGIALGLFFITFGTAQANPFTRKNTNPVPQHQDDSLQPSPEVSKSPTPGLGVPDSTIMERMLLSLLPYAVRFFICAGNGKK